MKFGLAMPAATIPRVATFKIGDEAPKVRIPFLSLLIQPRSLGKWYFMWGFCFYLAFCMTCYFEIEQPRLDHESGQRFGADSPTYWEAALYRTEHADGAKSLVAFESNLLGPVTIALLPSSLMSMTFVLRGMGFGGDDHLGAGRGPCFNRTSGGSMGPAFAGME